MDTSTIISEMVRSGFVVMFADHINPCDPYLDLEDSEPIVYLSVLYQGLLAHAPLLWTDNIDEKLKYCARNIRHQNPANKIPKMAFEDNLVE